MKNDNVTLFPQTEPEESEDVWQVGTILLPAWIEEDADKAPFRPVGALAVSLSRGLVGVSKSEEASGYRKVEEALADLARAAGALPDAIEVRDQALAELLREHRRWRRCEIRVSDTLEVLDRGYATLREGFASDSPLPPLMTGKGMNLPAVQSFAEAAVIFWYAAPWRRLSTDDLMTVELEPGNPELRHCVVMGSGGGEFGLLASDRREGLQFDEPTDWEDFELSHLLWSVSVDQAWEVPVADHDLWLAHHLPMPGGSRIPKVRRVSAGFEEVRSPSADELASLEALLRGLAATTEEQILAGTWSMTVPTSGGDHELRFSLPVIDEALVRELWDDVRAAWGIEADVEEGDDHQGGPLLDDPHVLSTLSLGTHGRRRSWFAARALELAPTMGTAYVASSLAAVEPARAVEIDRKGIAVQKETIGEESLGEHRGRVSEVEGGRTLLELCHQHAVHLAEAERWEQALEQDRELLELDESDRFGARHLLAAHLMAAGRPREALAWCDEHMADEPSADARYLHALAAYLTEGRGERSDRLLDRALGTNPWVARMLLGRVEPPEEEPMLYQPGGPDEAALHLHQFGWLWARGTNSEDWLLRGTVRQEKSRRPRGGASPGSSKKTRRKK